MAAPPAASLTNGAAITAARAIVSADTPAAADAAPDCTHAHCGACCHGVAAVVLPASAAQAPLVPAADARVGATRVLDLSGGSDGPFRPPRLAPA